MQLAKFVHIHTDKDKGKAKKRIRFRDFCLYTLSMTLCL